MIHANPETASKAHVIVRAVPAATAEAGLPCPVGAGFGASGVSWTECRCGRRFRSRAEAEEHVRTAAHRWASAVESIAEAEEGIE